MRASAEQNKNSIARIVGVRWKLDVLGRDMIGKPDAVCGAAEGEAGAVHVAGPDLEEDRRTASRADRARRLLVEAQMNGVPPAFAEARCAYGFEETADRAVKQDVRRRIVRVAQFHWH